MNDADLDDSLAVDVVTWVMYAGWLMLLSAGALWIGIEPLPSIVKAFDVRWQGQLAAVGSGALFVLVSRQVYDRIKARVNARAGASAEPEPVPEPDPAPKTSKKRKKTKKKKR